MANPEHLDLLKQGVGAWNAWRRENEGVQPELYEADLRGANLTGANLNNANLTEANLNGAILSRASLSGAHLSGAQLTGAILTEAKLNRAKLIRADLAKAKLIGVDLSGADLHRTVLYGASLQGVDLTEANLTEADLRGADLYNAKLIGADLSGATLTGVNLREAKLNKADLSRTDLTGVDFTGADLTGANLTGANLERANLTNSVLSKTRFQNSNLRGATGLDGAKLDEGIELDIRTIFNSWPLPDLILKAGGYDESVIKNFYSMLGHPQPIQFYDCFLSYSTNDEAFARRLFSDLTESGVSAFFAPEDIKIGDKIRLKIDEAIRIRDKLLLVLSEHSIESTWVAYEVEAAMQEELEKGKSVLFPIRLDEHIFETDVDWAKSIRQRHIGDFTDHDQYNTAFDRLLHDLKA